MTRRDSLDDLVRDVEALEPGEDRAARWTDVQIVIVGPDGEHRTPDGELVDDDREPIIRIGGEPPEGEP